MVAAGESAFATVESKRVSASGTIRLTSSYNFGVSFLIAELAKFKQVHPDVTFDLVLEDSVSNVIEERFDLAVRVGRLPDTGLFATELGTCRMLVCASPEFLRTHARINKPDDLVKLPWITITQLPHPETLNLVHGKTGQRLTLRLHAAVKTHAGIAAREFIRCGAGVGLLPDFAVAGDLRRGDLIRVLPAWSEAFERPISAVFPSRDRLPDPCAAPDRFPAAVGRKSGSCRRSQASPPTGVLDPERMNAGGGDSLPGATRQVRTKSASRCEPRLVRRPAIDCRLCDARS